MQKNHRRHNVEQEQLMKISDYSEGRSSNVNSSEVEEYPIQEFENYINQNNPSFSKPESYYIDRIEDLQRECEKYFNTCQQLTSTVNQLSEELEQSQQYALDAQDVGKVVNWLEEQINLYRQEFNSYRERQISISLKKDQEIQHLRKVVESVKEDRDSILKQKTYLDERNMDLETQNSNLLNQIDSLENELNDVKSMKSVSRMKTSKRTVFDDEIQAELQALIEKLMNELEVQRNNNRKSVQEIKRMQEEILELQRQIVSKSNKIYTLEMNNIKSKRQSPKNQSKLYMFQRNKSSTQLLRSHEKKDNLKSKSDRNTILKNIRLDDIISDQIDVSEKERYIIASKIASFYMKKYDTSDLEPYNPDQIFICNYNKTNPSLITIKKDPDHPPYREKTNPKVLSWNLGILLSKLLIEPTYESQFTDQSIELVHKSIDSFVHDENPNAKSVRELKNFLEEVLRSID